MPISKKQILAENIAAISAEFHTDKRFQRFYDTFGPVLGGFPAIWALMVEAANAFSSAVKPDENWIDVVTGFTDLIYSKALRDEDYLPTLDTNFFTLCAKEAQKTYSKKG